MIKEYIKKNIKTRKGRQMLFLEGIVLVGIVAFILIMTPPTITIDGHLGLLVILYVIASLYIIVTKTVKFNTHKDSNSEEDKE